MFLPSFICPLGKNLLGANTHTYTPIVTYKIWTAGYKTSFLS